MRLKREFLPTNLVASDIVPQLYMPETFHYVKFETEDEVPGAAEGSLPSYVLQWSVGDFVSALVEGPGILTG